MANFFIKASVQEYFKAVYLGLKFDLRLISLTHLLFFFILFLLPKKFFTSVVPRVILYLLWGGVFFVANLIYFVDFGHYSYLQKRVNISIFDNFENPYISLEMAYQSYPLIPILFALLALTSLSVYYFKKYFKQYLNTNYESSLKKSVTDRVFLFILLLAIAYGKLSFYPLRWSEAYFSPNNFISQWTLNPVLNFFETLKYDKDNFNSDTVKNYYPLVSEFLGVVKKDKQKLNFRRGENARPSSSPNIVIIQLESLASNRSSLFDNKLDPTPKIKELGDQSFVFKKFFTATEATARAVWAAVTGIPDIAPTKSSSRNPHLVDQKTILSDFNDYKKYYFLGGSANWGNIRSIFSNNVSDIHIYEEGNYSSEAERVDVWGISDLDLFKEAHKVLEKEGKPFVAYIQSAGFHRPYTIPKNNDGFKLQKFSDDEIRENGFLSLEEYNSLKFQDHAFGIFMELAKKSRYYRNTIFLIFGDHGIPVDGESQNMPSGYYKHRLVLHHVPLVIHYSKLKPGIDSKTIGSLVDLLPTAASLAGVSWSTNTLGRNLFKSRRPHQNYAFIYSWHTPYTLGLIGEEFYYQVRNDEEGLYRYESDDPMTNLTEKYPDQFKIMRNLTQGLYETSKYLRHNNKKR